MNKTAKKCYKVLLWKAYFDKGFSLTNYFKYILLVFGWATSSVNQTITIGLVWAIGCLILGRVWYKYKIVEIENEVANHFNPFMVEVRKAVKRR